MDIRFGVGQDSHRFCEDGERGMVIGGVLLEDEVKLKGNSDGDVVLHAIFNAISSAMGGRSIGVTADPMCLEDGITDSKEYLKVLISQMWESGFQLNNLSISIECERPKIEPIVGGMKKVICGMFGIEEDKVGITATSGEGLSDYGRGLGVQCFVVAGVVKG